MKSRRVVITGIGVLTSQGTDREKLWENLCNGVSGISRIQKFDASNLSSRIAAEINDFDPSEFMPRKEANRIDVFAQYGVVTSGRALKDANLALDALDPDRVGVIIGSGIGGLIVFEEQYKRVLKRGYEKCSAFFIPKMMMNAVSGHISIRFGMTGPNYAVASACASASHAMGLALRTIQYGDADVILTGGTEATVTPLGVAGFCALKALSERNDEPERASRPFDKDRDGFVVGEGASVMVFEELEHARARDARIYAEMVGVGATGDAYHITAPDPEGTGAARAMTLAIKDAGRKPEDVTYINAHGTSTPFNDPMEVKAIKKALGEDVARGVAISSSKSMLGHMLGAAGAIEAAVTALSLHHDRAHPTANLETPDPDCDLDFIPGEARDIPMRLALSNSFGFGGHNATVALAKFEG
ncbi:MAG: beta-ketoacyl-ACP synthase II [Planctomycetota bacterium]|jgi:3-oxoacyl-[acyl-carrier-protein] synthase II